jgi:hypothetical protein
MAEEKKEVYLEADKEIPGQHYVCLSFISPQDVLKNKDVYFFSEFLKDYEVQYKIRATEGFVMAQVKKLQDVASNVQDVLENLRLQLNTNSANAQEDLSGALASITSVRGSLTSNVATDLEAHVKSEMSDFKESTMDEAYKAFLFKNKKRLEDDFFAKNSFRTTVQGLKIRGVYDTYNEAAARAKTIQKLDPSFNVYVGQVGFWLPWDPSPSDVSDQEYADDQLNTLMKHYRTNESQRDEFFQNTKQNRLTGAKIGANKPAPTDMFSGEDLAIARKREQNKNVVA